MNALIAWKKQCDANGFRKGESAADFRKRDPQAAMNAAEFMNTNMPKLVSEFTNVVVAVSK